MDIDVSSGPAASVPALWDCLRWNHAEGDCQTVSQRRTAPLLMQVSSMTVMSCCGRTKEQLGQTSHVVASSSRRFFSALLRKVPESAGSRPGANPEPSRSRLGTSPAPPGSCQVGSGLDPGVLVKDPGVLLKEPGVLKKIPGSF